MTWARDITGASPVVWMWIDGFLRGHHLLADLGAISACEQCHLIS